MRPMKPEEQSSFFLLVPETGFEPVRPVRAGGFKSAVSAISPLEQTHHDNLKPTHQRSIRKNHRPSFFPNPILSIRLFLSNGIFVIRNYNTLPIKMNFSKQRFVHEVLRSDESFQERRSRPLSCSSSEAKASVRSLADEAALRDFLSSFQFLTCSSPFGIHGEIRTLKGATFKAADCADSS